MNENFLAQMERDRAAVNAALEEHLLSLEEEGGDKSLIEAQRYSLLIGGKRIRPILTLAFARFFGGNDLAAMPYAMAVEMMHTASLIHDDLPAIDDDDLRRGKPTSHKVFDEATAILAADALFMDAFGIIAENDRVETDNALFAISSFSRATGTLGLVGGEFIDVMGEGKKLELSELRKMHSMKTGALISASVQLGVLAAGIRPYDDRMTDSMKYARNIGLAFQIVDDVLDRTGSTEELGKQMGRDDEKNKNTYLSFYSPEEALKYAKTLTDNAVTIIRKYKGSEFFVELARYLTERRN